MIGELLTVKEIEELRDAPVRQLIALHNVSVMGQSCLRVGGVERSDEILEVVVDELRARGAASAEGVLLG